MTDAFIYLVVAAMLGVLFALVLSIRRLMNLEFRQTKLLNTIKRIELRDIAMEERTYKILKKLDTKAVKPKAKPKRKPTTSRASAGALIKSYERRTGKKAVWQGKQTKGFKDWKKKRK